MRTWIAWSAVTLVAVYSVQAAASHMPQGQLAKPPVQESYRGVTIGRLEKWLDAIDRHKPGEADASFDQIRPWGPQEVDELLIDLNALLTLMRDDRAKMFFRPSNGSRPPIACFLYAASPGSASHPRPNEKIRNDENQNPQARRTPAYRHRCAVAFCGQVSAEEPPARSQRLMVYFDDGRRLGFENAAEHWRAARLLLDQVGPGIRATTNQLQLGTR